MLTLWSTYRTALAYLAFSFFGGALGYAMRTVDKKQPLNYARVFLEGASAAFVGMLVLLMCSAIGLSQQWTGVIVGVCGWLGASATIRIIESVVRNKLGIGSNPDPQPEESPNGNP